MSQEDVDVVRRMWAAYAAGNFDMALKAYANDAVWDDTNYRPDGEVHVGKGALVGLVSSWREAWDWKSYKVEVERLYDAAEGLVVAALRESGRGKGGGVELTNRWGLVTTIRDGEIVHTMVYRTAAEALEAVGLSE
jgi:ketosteroid isomerase-like protein